MCIDIRGILFPLQKDGTLFKKTREDPPEKLYDSIIEAFDSAIADIALRQESGQAVLIHEGGKGRSNVLLVESSMVLLA